MKACQSITSTINSTVSFTTRPSECVDVFEQIFTQEGVSGQTGVYNEAEESSWGNTDGLCGSANAGGATIHVNARQGFKRVRDIFNCDSGQNIVQPNKGFISRRADMRSGGGADPINGTQYAGLNNYERDEHAVFLKYDYKTNNSAV